MPKNTYYGQEPFDREYIEQRMEELSKDYIAEGQKALPKQKRQQ